MQELSVARLVPLRGFQGRRERVNGGGSGELEVGEMAAELLVDRV